MKKRIDLLQILNTRPFARAKTIAIVGNAGIEEEDNEKINAADCVIRFNNYATRGELQFTRDRFRCDVLFSTFDLHSMGSEPGHVVIGIPFPFKADAIADKLTRWYPRSVPYMVNPYWVRQSCIDLGLQSMGDKHPMPSIGTTCLYHLLKIISNTPTFSPQVFVAGFALYSDHEDHSRSSSQCAKGKPLPTTGKRCSGSSATSCIIRSSVSRIPASRSFRRLNPT